MGIGSPIRILTRPTGPGFIFKDGKSNRERTKDTFGAYHQVV